MILHYEAQLYLLRSLVGRTFKAGGYILYGLVTLLCDRQVKLLLIPFNPFVTAVNVTSCFLLFIVSTYLFTVHSFG